VKFATLKESAPLQHRITALKPS